MKPFKKLIESENEADLKFPAYISFLEANGDNKPDEAEKKSAINFSYLKTYSPATFRALRTTSIVSVCETRGGAKD